MNQTVKFNTDYSLARLERHKDFAGEISIENFCTYENKNSEPYYTAVERSKFKKKSKNSPNSNTDNLNNGGIENV